MVLLQRATIAALVLGAHHPDPGDHVANSSVLYLR
jgi:hypothetical protein